MLNTASVLDGDAVAGHPMEVKYTSIQLAERTWSESERILKAIAAGRPVSPQNLAKVKAHLTNFLALVELREAEHSAGTAD